MSKSYAPEVIADDSGKWTGNALRFRTEEEAEKWVKDLFSRWTMVRDTRVAESDDEPNWTWVGGDERIAPIKRVSEEEYDG